MSDDILNKTLNGIMGIETIRIYLTKEKISTLMKEIIKEMIKSNDSYLYELSEDKNLKKFKKSLKKGHFKWMIDRTFSRNVIFDDNYILHDIDNNFAYCAFYTILLSKVKKIQNPEKKYMLHYCNFLLQKYSCK